MKYYINDKKMESVEESKILSFLKDNPSSICRKSSSDINMKQSESKKTDVEDRVNQFP